jgi:FkbM family methyltransferase
MNTEDKFILFDIGANWGRDSLDRTRDNENIICFAFEPTPMLYDNLVKESESFKDRYFVFPYALSDFNGKSKFNVAGQSDSDWGCSSLLEFSDGLDKTWEGRTDFVVTEEIEVEVVTMKKFLEELSPFKINRINFLHCDAQGSDLNILKGFDEHISIIEEGVIEAPQNDVVKLYKNQFLYDDVLEFFANNNIVQSELVSQQNEYNIYFKRA